MTRFNRRATLRTLAFASALLAAGVQVQAAEPVRLGAVSYTHLTLPTKA